MSRTEELRRGGATERGGGGGGAPFVRWPDSYAFIEGRVINVWTGKYGDTATLHVTGASPGLQAGGKTEDGEKYARKVTPGTEVNVGLNYASLQGTISAADQGAHFHIAFEGWGETKKGDRFRMFAVLETPGDKAAVGADPPDYGAPPHDDDDLPF
jgi:hypothetical protein